MDSYEIDNSSEEEEDFTINYIKKDEKNIKDPEERRNVKIMYKGKEYYHDFGTLIRRLDRE